MSIRLPSVYALLGASLALMLQTNYRFVEAIGPGELLAVFFAVFILMRNGIVRHTPNQDRIDTLTIHFVAIVLLIITPMTLLSNAILVTGTSIRDLLAYYFICVILLALPKSIPDVRMMVYAFLIVIFSTVIAQYLFGGPNAYYYLRFTGGAKNPNQLGIYLMVALAFSVYLPQIWMRAIVALLAIFFGTISYSDAFLVAIFVLSITFFALTILPPRVALYLSPAFLVFVYIVFTFTSALDIFVVEWTSADQGGARGQLTLSAMKAWLSTPISAIFGHGAGSFSGLNAAFEGAEAHNTALDLATIAGFFGLYLFPLRPMLLATKSLSKNLRLVPAVMLAIVAFGLFHFVGRQPVFWVTLVLLERLIRNSNLGGEQPSRESENDKAVRT